MDKVAVILFNLGGPDGQEAVRPFLFNLFSDRAIIGLPNPFRWLLAKVISSRREAEAKHIYQQMGGGSPILPQTQAQADALERELNGSADAQYRVFIAMRYWHPRAKDTVARVAAFQPDRVVLLPLYPQFSTTTTASSFQEWRQEARQAGLDVPTRQICCYPTEPRFIEAHAEHLATRYAELAAAGPVRVLFSAHGLPEKIIASGDPYQHQVEQTVAAVIRQCGLDSIDYQISYQSRVGPLAWIGPATDAEIRRAGAEKIQLIVIPIAFVSEHSETLVELDIQYRELAAEHGVSRYERLPAIGAAQLYIQSLADLAVQAFASERDATASHTGGRFCPSSFTRCPCSIDSKE